MGRNEIGWWFVDWIVVARDKNEWLGCCEQVVNIRGID